MIAKFDQLDAMVQQQEEPVQDDEDEFSKLFKTLNIKDTDDNRVTGYEEYNGLWMIIKKYKECRCDKRLEARRFINIIRFNALSFFIYVIQDQQVLSTIFKSIKSYPDKAIKLYFYCLEYGCLNLLDEDFIYVIEEVIRNAILFYGDKFNLRFISFYRHWKTKKPILEVRVYGGGWDDYYESRLPAYNESKKPVQKKFDFCVIS